MLKSFIHTFFKVEKIICIIKALLLFECFRKNIINKVHKIGYTLTLALTTKYPYSAQ